jgi:Protein of unknown function (DUF2510)
VSERAAGWYPDPWTDGQYRYWTGTSWTADVFPEGLESAATSLGSPAHPSDPSAPPPTAPSAVPPAPPHWGPPSAEPATEVLAQQPWTPIGPAPSGARSRGAVFMALMLLAGLLIGFLGVFGAQQLLDQRSKSSTPNSAAATPPATPQLPSAAPSAPADPAAAVLPKLVVRQSDVSAAVTVSQLQNGTSVSGAATLDLCNGTFPSESLRTARLQVAASDDQGTAQLSTEAVAYRNANATAQAFAELKAVVRRCPDAPVESPVGEPTVTTKFLTAPDSSWPQTAGVQRLAYQFTTTDATGATSASIAVYLRRGRILLGVYFPQAARKQTPVASQSSVAGIVRVFQDRLAQLPSAVVGS